MPEWLDNDNFNHAAKFGEDSLNNVKAFFKKHNIAIKVIEFKMEYVD